MAKNIRGQGINAAITHINVVPTQPATPASGDPCLFGVVPGVAEGAPDAYTGCTVLNIDCIADLAVNAVDQSGNSAVVAGDQLYYVAADTIKISKKNTGVKFGVAYGNLLADLGPDTKTGTLIASGQNATIRVLVGH